MAKAFVLKTAEAAGLRLVAVKSAPKAPKAPLMDAWRAVPCTSSKEYLSASSIDCAFEKRNEKLIRVNAQIAFPLEVNKFIGFVLVFNHDLGLR